MTLVVVLVLVAGGAVLVQVTDQMRGEADGRLDGHTVGLAGSLDAILQRASSDIRLARRNVTFETALADSPGQLLPADRAAVNAAITYLGDRYHVDEICMIRASGLEAARWVSGKGVAAVSDLSPDERQNNPAVVPTLPLADDAHYETQPYISPDSNRWVIGVATPIVLSNGDHAGVLHLEIPLDQFAAALGASPFGGSSYSVLLDRDGKLLVHPEIAQFRAAATTSTDPNTGPLPSATGFGSASWRAAVSTITSGATGSTTFEEGTQSYRVSFAPVPDTNQIVAVISPTSELYADINRILLNLLVTAGPLLILMVGVTGWFARRMARAKGGLEGLNERLALTNAELEQAGRVSGDLARESAIVNQFTELTALTEDESSLAEASLATLDELVHPDNASLHVSNPSQDRAVPQATLGDQGAEVLSLHELARCPAVRRSSLYVTDDVAARLSFHCPVYPVTSGTLACVPLVALGETIGSVHLHWSAVRELSLPARLAIMRVSEHSALSIANRRLLLALRGQANTDGGPLSSWIDYDGRHRLGLPPGRYDDRHSAVGEFAMPMIGVYATEGTFADRKGLAKDLAAAVMRWEGVPEIPLFKENTAAFIHDLAPDALSNVVDDSNYVRVQILTPVGVLDRDKQLGVVRDLTDIVAAAAGDPSLTERTWVLIVESPEGGWGIDGHAYTNAEIAQTARRALAGA